MSISVDDIPACRLSAGGEELEKSFFLTAGEADARASMSVRLMAMRAIEVATDHSNVLGIGYADLAELNLRWVLLKLTAEITRFPAINEPYRCRTWIESVNRFFSNRLVEFVDARGESIIRIHTVWAAIDRDTRQLSSLDALPRDRFPACGRALPIARLAAPALADEGRRERVHRFGTADIDFNRHVNAVSYISAALNCIDLAEYDTRPVRRLDVSYEHECYYGEDIRIVCGADRAVADALDVELHHPQGRRAAILRLVF